MKMYSKYEQQKIKEAIVFSCQKLANLENSNKPVLLHAISVGTRLYSNNYQVQIVIAGYLHDIIEDTHITKRQIEKKFGREVSEIVLANTKNTNIKERSERHRELIKRCLSHSEKAAIVKAADILDNYTYYTNLADQYGINYCLDNIQLFKRYMQERYTDRIFTEMFTIIK